MSYKERKRIPSLQPSFKGLAALLCGKLRARPGGPGRRDSRMWHRAEEMGLNPETWASPASLTAFQKPPTGDSARAPPPPHGWEMQQDQKQRKPRFAGST